MKALRKENRGFTLVELICGIGILSCITAAVATVLVVSAKSYRNGIADTGLQQEAQFTVNRIGGLIVDATKDVKYYYKDAGSFVEIANGALAPSGSDRKLSIVNDDVTYDIILSGGNLTYSEVSTADPTLVYAADLMLAEGVSEFNADVTDFATDHNVRMQMSFARNNRDFEGTYNMTSRNGMAQAQREESAMIVVPSQITLEPSQVYSLSYSVMGITNSAVTCTLAGATAAGTSVTAPGGNRVEISVATGETGDAQGNLYLTLSTVKTKEDGVTPMDTKVVIVHVRRVTSVSVADEPAAVGKYSDGDKIFVKATPGGFYLDKVPGADYDLDYKDTRALEWSYQFYIMNDLRVYEPKDYTSYFEITDFVGNTMKKQIKLKRDMPRGSKLVVTVKALHPEGTVGGAAYNKTGVKYGTVSGIWEYERTPQGIVWRNEGFKRGNDNMEFETVFTYADKTNLRDSNANGNGNAQFSWFYRFREHYVDDTYGPWGQYYKMKEGGTQEKLNAEETLAFLPDKAYECQIMGAIVTTDGSNILYWPHDESLLTGTTGFSGWHKGWSGDDVTAVMDYSGIFEIDKVAISFRENAAYGIAEGATSVGSVDAPLSLVTGNDFDVEVAATGIEISHFQSCLKARTQKWIGTGWDDATPSGFGFQEGLHYRINNIQSTTNDKYRFGVVMKDADFKYITGDVLNPTYHTIEPRPVFDFGNPSTGDGIIHVKFN